ncbi:hypothetical protein HN747_01375 [archaeon]|jgi:hypothetical protein|nr:hypothetical protein [archaeon]
MKDLSAKVAEIMGSSGEEVELFKNLYNDGTPEEPDIIFYRFYAAVEGDDEAPKTVGVYISKEDKEFIFDGDAGTGVIYKFPLLEDRKAMERMFAEIVLRECE